MRTRRIRPYTRCSVEGCREDVWARGMCRSHYWSWYRHGDPLVQKKRPNGTGSVTHQGYHKVTVDGVPRLVHVVAAERALGKRLPAGAIVHHVDEDKSHNEGTNLVVCPDQSYHRLLHERMKAMEACGNPNWRRCRYCKEYDALDRLRAYKDGKKTVYVHRACNAARGRSEYWKNKE